MENKKKLVPLKRDVGDLEYHENALTDTLQGSVVLNKAFGHITVHFHYQGKDRTIKNGDKIYLHSVKTKLNNNSTYGFKGLYKLPIMESVFMEDCKTIEEFKDKCANKAKEKNGK